MNKLEFDIIGYLHLKNIIPTDYLSSACEITLDLKNKIINENLLGTKKDFGIEQYWRGLDMASKLNENLYKLYTSEFMYNIVKQLLGDTIYLFNDQIVVKLPNEDFEFDVHTDNMRGPNPKEAALGNFKTITCCWVLDDFTNDNGCIEILNKKTKQWDKPLASAGDIIIWDGNSYHKSYKNKTDKPRRVYLMVYSTHDMHKFSTTDINFLNKYYSNEFVLG
jgi:hypothetical protein